MYVVMMLNLDEETVKDIQAQDLQGNDYTNEINDAAIVQGEPHGVWHFHKADFRTLHHTIDDVFVSEEVEE